jgi:hypothetical protein
MSAKIKPQSAKNKGRKFQHWIAEKISELTGYSYGSAGQDKEIESRPMGQSGTDIRMESHVLKKFPYSVEAKHQENWSVHQWIQQAKENQMQGTDWLLFCKRNRKDPIVIMDAEVFFELLKKIK